MKNITFLYCFIFILFISLPACMNQGLNISGPSSPPSLDDPCSGNLYRLQSYDKSNTMNDTLASWTKCMATCYMDSILDSKTDCRTKCNKLIDTKKIVSNFIATSEEEQKRLQQINLEIDHLQQCRNIESKQILARLESKDPVQRETARGDYKNFKKKVDADNELLGQLLAESGKRIAEQEKTMAEIDKIEPASVESETVPDVPDTKVRSGYNIRTAPSTKTGKVIGKTSQTVKIKQIEGRWVSLYYPSAENAWVHIKAFPSITPDTQIKPKKEKKEEVRQVHAATKKQHAESVEKKSDYAKDMDLRMSEMDEVLAASS